MLIEKENTVYNLPSIDPEVIFYALSHYIWKRNQQEEFIIIIIITILEMGCQWRFVCDKNCSTWIGAEKIGCYNFSPWEDVSTFFCWGYWIQVQLNRATKFLSKLNVGSLN